jgi:putative sigma-54 modulation protein
MKMNLCIRNNRISREGQILALKTFSTALDHLQKAIQSVRITITDENGPRGGIDKSCSAQIKLFGGNTLVLSEKASNFHQAVALTAEKAKESLARWHDKQRTSNRRQGRKLNTRSRRLIELMEA